MVDRLGFDLKSNDVIRSLHVGCQAELDDYLVVIIDVDISVGHSTLTVAERYFHVVLDFSVHRQSRWHFVKTGRPSVVLVDQICEALNRLVEPNSATLFTLWQFFSGGKRLEGRKSEPILDSILAPVRKAVTPIELVIRHQQGLTAELSEEILLHRHEVRAHLDRDIVLWLKHVGFQALVSSPSCYWKCL